MKTRKDLLDILTKTEEEQAKWLYDYDAQGVISNTIHCVDTLVLWDWGNTKIVGFGIGVSDLAFRLRDMAVHREGCGYFALENACVEVWRHIIVNSGDVRNAAHEKDIVAYYFAYQATPFQLIIASLLVLDCED